MEAKTLKPSKEIYWSHISMSSLMCWLIFFYLDRLFVKGKARD